MCGNPNAGCSSRLPRRKGLFQMALSRTSFSVSVMPKMTLLRSARDAKSARL
ncbi:hypothetical protein M378DRAFT_159001 [Amanita muscaria Koide BX008]|uniref:Uncharacterized protein n=1 Tax=Amanita muscaria (strain Koide BX008) TaxID=946122 RepID=A0A0C2XFZ6_AMAMK|nr:hypothetical protein M378DRAFT_159001 [Amanita muscaria Koide BX008]